jgi:hypothetical protein
MEPKKKPKVQTAKILRDLKFANPADEEAKKAYPNLYEILCPVWREGAMVRQAGRMTLKPDGSAWRVSFECPTEGLQTSMVVEHLGTLWADVEKLLASGKCHWGLTWAKQKKNLPVVDDLIE